ncbi:anoctamin-7-like [Pectinophora gossypiella]|uniref:anoctamin-7-like n=1 Tax=Pectinophora gossypiella TaxID=13191 RepID=UPI00214E0B1D|nr:anoctamin-7-like [Pectinophora gossypiella]
MGASEQHEILFEKLLFCPRPTHVVVMFHSAAYATTTLFERHLTYERFEKSLVSKYFFYSLVYATNLVVYFTWLKGALYDGFLDVWYATVNVTTPWAAYELPTPNISEYLTFVVRRALTSNCAPFACFHEGVIVFIVTLLFREVIVRTIDIVKRNTHKKVETQNEMTTCERERRLQPVTERQLVGRFNALFVQLALVTLFAPLCPLAPLLALVGNAADMRNQASTYVMHSRRAVLFRSAGIGYWNHILKLICYATPLFHVSPLRQWFPITD